MSEALYERYKDALRRGHVAAMHGRADVAVAAYVEAATIAPERALPHSSIGAVYMRLGRHREALAAYDAALARVPRDEAGLAGRASALEALGRRSEAAAALDELVSVQEAAGRLADACDTARRALELAESRPRRRAVEGLVARLRESGPAGTEAEALARALQLLESTGVAEPSPEPGPSAAEAGGSVTPEGGAESTVPPVPSLSEVLEIVDRAEAAAAAGRHTEARLLFLEAAAGHARGGRPDAALDACAAAVAIEPAEPDPHLVLAGLYLDRGWRASGAEKLALLDRLAELTGDAETRERIRRVVDERLGGDAATIPGPSTGR